MTTKRADNRYQKKFLIGYLADGRPKYKYVYGKTKKELEEKYLRARIIHQQGCAPEKMRMTVSQLAEEWYEYKLPGWKESTAAGERTTLNYISRKIGYMIARDVRVTHVDGMRLEALRNGEASSYNSAITALKAIYVYACRREYLHSNPFQYAERIKIPRRPKRALTAEELTAIENADLTPPQRLFVDIIRYTGMRKGEALALTADDLDLFNHRIIVHRNVFDGRMQDTPKTAAGVRKIPMPGVLYREIKAMRPSGLLFPNKNGEPMRPASFDLFWRDIKRRIFGDNPPSDFSPHLFRHNYASDLFKAGLDLKSAQYLLGHTDIKTTLDTYTHYGFDDIKIDRLEMLYAANSRVSTGCQRRKQA